MDDESTIANGFLDTVAAIVIQTSYRRHMAMIYVDELIEQVANDMHARFRRLQQQRQADSHEYVQRTRAVASESRPSGRSVPVESMPSTRAGRNEYFPVVPISRAPVPVARTEPMSSSRVAAQKEPKPSAPVAPQEERMPIAPVAPQTEPISVSREIETLPARRVTSQIEPMPSTVLARLSGITGAAATTASHLIGPLPTRVAPQIEPMPSAALEKTSGVTGASPTTSLQNAQADRSESLRTVVARHSGIPRQRDAVHEKCTRSAILIQALFRGFWARDSLDVDHYCATIIQRSFKRLTFRLNYLFLISRVVHIQSVWRRSTARDTVAIKLGAVIAMQAYVRGFHTRKRMKEQLSERGGFRERKHLKERLTTKGSSPIHTCPQGTVQPSWQAQQVLRDNKVANAAVANTAVPVSNHKSFARARQRKILSAKKENWAATKIQSAYRRSVCEMQFIRSLVDILIVQTVVRRWMALRLSKQLRLIRRYSDSARVLHR
jgi:hypothetical protein